MPIYTKDLLTLSADANIPVVTINAAINLQNTSFTTGTVAYSNTSGNITLNANKTYRLAAMILNSSSGGSLFQPTFMWSSNNAPVSTNTRGQSAWGSNFQSGSVEVFIQTSSSTANVKIAPLGINGTGNAATGSWVVVEEIGPTALTTDLYLSGNITANVIGGYVGSNSVTLLNYKDSVYNLPYAATITPNPALGSIQNVTLTGNVILNNFGGTPQAGQSVTLKLIQDATGNRVLSSTMKWAGGFKTLSTTAGAIDIATIWYDGTTYFGSLTRGYQ
jgi:hypothetical protein